MIRDTFNNDPVTAVAVALGESELNQYAYNPEKHYDGKGNYLCSGSYGIMQIACSHHLENPTALYDVEFNIAMAKKIHNERGWQPWGAYTDGRYLEHLAIR